MRFDEKNRALTSLLRLLLCVVVVPISALSACGADVVGRTLKVPAQYATIQEAVRNAKSGDLILVEPGVYHEAVSVTVDNIVIRGTDRNEVILDGQYKLTDGVRVAGADGVAIENMTARNYLVNGFYWVGSRGYRASYLTAVRNGYYGIYALDSRGGLIEHSYASGSYDAGFYVGQCVPCDMAITDSIAEWNGLGYSGTNASKNLVVARSIFRMNRVGIMPNSGDYEKYSPQRDAIFVGNSVYSNNNLKAPAFQQIAPATGNGIVIAGGINNLVTRNNVWDHDVAGIAVVPNIVGTTFPASENVVRENHVSQSRMADLAISSSEELSNCFEMNSFASSMPQNIEIVRACGENGAKGIEFFPIAEVLKRKLPPSPNNQSVKDPPAQLTMPNARRVSREPASPTPPEINIEMIALPAGKK